MSEFSKISINGTTYDVKDATSRHKTDWCVSPELYGAKGDGSTDDSAAFTNAVKDGRPIVLKGTATYCIKNVTLTNDTVIYGHGATIKAIAYNSSSNQYANVFTCTGKSLSFHEINFKGLGDATATTSLVHFIKLTNCKVLFKRCTFKDIKTKNANTQTSFANRFGVVLTAVDCDDIRYDECEFSNVGGEEVIWVTPNSDSLDASVFTMERCDYHDCAGYSINAFCGKVVVRDNYFHDLNNSTVSLFNVAANTFVVENNVIRNAVYSDLFDCFEVGYLRATNVRMSGNDIETDSSAIMLASCENGEFVDNKIEFGGTTVLQTANYTMGATSAAPSALDYTTNLVTKSVVISGNVIHFKDGKRAGYMCFVGRENEVTPYPSSAIKTNYLQISDNTLYYDDSASNGALMPFYISTHVEHVVIDANTIYNLRPSRDITSGTGASIVCLVNQYNVPVTDLKFINNVILPGSDVTLLSVIYGIVAPGVSISPTSYVTDITICDNLYGNDEITKRDTIISHSSTVASNYTDPTITDIDENAIYSAIWQSASTSSQPVLTVPLTISKGKYLIFVKTPSSSSSGSMLVTIGASKTITAVGNGATYIPYSYGYYSTYIESSTANTIYLQSVASANNGTWASSTFTHGGIVAVRL